MKCKGNVYTQTHVKHSITLKFNQINNRLNNNNNNNTKCTVQIIVSILHAALKCVIKFIIYRLGLLYNTLNHTMIK
jgi:hypothetical protein